MRHALCVQKLATAKRIHGTIFSAFHSQNQEPNANTKPHRFEKCSSFKNEIELANHLTNNIIYQDDDVLVFNKPTGVPIYGPPLSDPRSRDINSSVSFENSLKVIQEEMNLKHWHFSYSPPRLYSGVVVISTTKSRHEELSRYFVTVKQQKKMVQQLRLLLCGIPTEVDSRVTFPICRDRVPDGYLFYKSPSLSKKLTKKRQLIRFEMDLRLLKTNKLSDAEVAYAEADVHTLRWDGLELCCSQHHRVPVLGDDLYSHRLNTLQGVNVVKSPHACSVQRFPQILERSILRALRLNDTALLPLHVHVHQLQLPRANPTAKSMKANRELFTLTAPLPDFFTQSLKDLGLNDEDLGADR